MSWRQLPGAVLKQVVASMDRLRGKDGGGSNLWGYHGVPPNGWFMMEHPSKMNDLGAPYFLRKTSIICFPWIQDPNHGVFQKKSP